MQCQNIKAESFYIWNLKLIKGKDEGEGGNLFSKSMGPGTKYWF